MNAGVSKQTNPQDHPSTNISDVQLLCNVNDKIILLETNNFTCNIIIYGELANSGEHGDVSSQRREGDLSNDFSIFKI